MAKHELRNLAINMRKEGASYSQIKATLGISKGTLSGWLQQYPLSPENLKKLTTATEQRVERVRQTKARKKEQRLLLVKENAVKKIGGLSERELFIGGIFLYWGEGTKTADTTTSVSNTDPTMLIFFTKWLEALGMPREKIRVRLQLYSDMNIQKEMEYWSKMLNIPLASFRKPYVKKSLRSGLSYPQKFTHGTCNVLFHNRDLYESTNASLAHIRSLFAPKEDA